MVVGSGVHGIAVAGTDDHDDMGACSSGFSDAWVSAAKRRRPGRWRCGSRGGDAG
jgi:hypothetical protein